MGQGGGQVENSMGNDHECDQYKEGYADIRVVEDFFAGAIKS